MVKLIALYNQPENKEAFDDHYQNVHTPVTKKIPGLRKMEVTKIVGAPTGESPYYLLCEMYYDDMDALKKSNENRRVESLCQRFDVLCR